MLPRSLLPSENESLGTRLELDQITEGLKVMDVVDLIQSNVNKMRPLLVCMEPVRLTADAMINMFPAVLSPAGSNIRESEEAVTMQWVNYIQITDEK